MTRQEACQSEPRLFHGSLRHSYLNLKCNFGPHRRSSVLKGLLRILKVLDLSSHTEDEDSDKPQVQDSYKMGKKNCVIPVFRIKIVSCMIQFFAFFPPFGS